MPEAIANSIRERMVAVPAGHVPLARMLEHSLAVGTSSAPAAAQAAAQQTSTLVTSQEAHAHLRALPLLLGCYLGHHGRVQVKGPSISLVVQVAQKMMSMQWLAACFPSAADAHSVSCQHA